MNESPVARAARPRTRPQTPSPTPATPADIRTRLIASCGWPSETSVPVKRTVAAKARRG